MYRMPQSLLVANPINRYLINSPMLPTLNQDPDGGYTIYLQKDSPGADKESNWLPAPEGPFAVIMRLYWPEPPHSTEPGKRLCQSRFGDTDRGLDAVRNPMVLGALDNGCLHRKKEARYMSGQDTVNRTHLPIPSKPRTGLITYDAKDPDSSYPPIEQLRPPAGAPNVLLILLDDVGFGASSAFGGPCQTPVAERLAAGGSEIQPLPHHRAVFADAAGAADRTQSPLGRHGRDHRDRHRCTGIQLRASKHHVAARADVEAQRIQHRPVRQVP